MKKSIFTPAVICFGLVANVAAAEVSIVTTIKPLHSIISAITGDIYEPVLLIEGNASPHDFSLKPSQAQQLQDADIVFWIGDKLESFLPKSLENISAKSVEMIDNTAITKLSTRALASFEVDEDNHDGHGHNDHDAHAEKKDDDNGHDHHGTDPHIWLDPENAAIMAQIVSDSLSDADPENAETYANNAKAFQSRLKILATTLQDKAKNYSGLKFITYHDGYQYFENRVGLASSGTIAINPEVAPSAGHIRELRETIAQKNITCVFSEPQFSDAITKVVAEGLNIKTAQLDPLGANLDQGPELYFNLIENMARSFEQCLTNK